MTSRRPSRPDIVVPALIGHVLLTGLAWRDIARRDPSELRGSKNLWRVVTALNTGNHTRSTGSSAYADAEPADQPPLPRRR